MEQLRAHVLLGTIGTQYRTKYHKRSTHNFCKIYRMLSNIVNMKTDPTLFNKSIAIDSFAVYDSFLLIATHARIIWNTWT